jgi:hypothetical protein
MRKDIAIQATIECSHTFTTVQKLDIEKQADAIYDLPGRVTDALADFGFDPTVVANVVWDLAGDLQQRDGAPMKVVRLPSRRKP